MPFPFEVGFDEVRSNLDVYVDAVFGCLESEFLVMPKGDGFVEFSVFEAGYEALKRATGVFREVTPDTVAPVVFETPIALIVLRCMLGFTPPEWAYYASRHTGVNVTQSAARTIDRSIRMKPDTALSRRGRVTERRLWALVAAACHALESASHHRGEADRRRRHGPGQGDASAAPWHARSGRPAGRRKQVRGGCVHCRTRLRRAPRGHEEAASCHTRQGLYATERASARGTHAAGGISFPAGARAARRIVQAVASAVFPVRHCEDQGDAAEHVSPPQPFVTSTPSISTLAPLGSEATPIAARAG